MTGARRGIPHLFKLWERIAEQILQNKRLVLYLDFDGTPMRIVPMPEGVRLKRGACRVLQKLAVRRR